MTKKERHRVIKEIIITNEIECQEDLLTILEEKGVEVTQATLSRDMKEMKVVKVPTSQGYYIYQFTENITTSFTETGNLSDFGFVGIQFSGNLAVIKTRPAHAMMLAAEIDGRVKKEIIGTVAGDDTILLVVREGVSKESVIKALSVFIKNI